MVNEPIESLYFNWLCAKVMRIENPTPTLTYWKLLKKLHQTQFVWVVLGDDNRASEGLELRYEFLRCTLLEREDNWWNEECSVLEILIAFIRRAEFQTEISESTWFWRLIDNLGLTSYNDADFNDREVDDILYQFIWRTYDYYGHGGLFPLNNTEKDQRKLEIWFQFFEYLEDQGLM